MTEVSGAYMGVALPVAPPTLVYSDERRVGLQGSARGLRRPQNVLFQLRELSFEPSQRRQDLLGLIASLGLHEARGDRGREH